MATAELAQFVAAHVLPLLGGLALLLLLGSALLWIAIERWMPRVFALASPLWRRVDARGFAARYLGLHAAISFVIATTGIAIFIELADEVGVGEDLHGFDEALAQALGAELSEATLRAFALLTHLGDPLVLTGIGIVVAAVLLLRREWLLASSWAVATLGSAALNSSLKLLFARARPEFTHDIARADGYSFPSGHSSGSMVVYGLLAYLVVRHTPRAWHWPAAGVAMLLIVFVGASRVLLQVHYFSDVLAGWTSGAAWTALCVAGLEAWRLGVRRRGTIDA